MRFPRSIACAYMLLAAACAPIFAQEELVGPWHGVLDHPMGPLTLIVTIMEGEDGALRAELESPDQAPGRTVPVTTITAADHRLTFTVGRIGARFEGEWDESAQRWSGVFTQGAPFQLILERGLPAPRPVVEGLDGVWEGAVTRNGVDLRLVLRVSTSEYGTIVTFDSPDMNAVGLPVRGFTREAEAVELFVPASGAAYEGTLSDGDTRLVGTWKLPGRPDATVTFVRTRETSEREARERPQTPAEPFGYRSEEVTFDNPEFSDVRLAGTLTLPEGNGPFPGAILISGSGPQDRDETVWGHKPFAVLADHLTRQGIAVLRYDDRGFGASTGSHASATSADFATDANAAAAYLVSRPEIDRDAIGFVGHSEGGVIGPIAAVENDEIDFLVMLAGPGTNTLRLIRSQRHLMGLSQGMTDEELVRTDEVVDRIARAVAAASDGADAAARVRELLTAHALETLGVPESRRELVVQQYTTDWFRYFVRYDPAAFLSRVDVPVLALNGSLDVQVPADENLAGIRRALAHNRDVTVRELEGLNHLFQTAETGKLGEYADIPETFAPVALEIVADWINARFGSGRAGYAEGTGS